MVTEVFLQYDSSAKHQRLSITFRRLTPTCKTGLSLSLLDFRKDTIMFGSGRIDERLSCVNDGFIWGFFLCHSVKPKRRNSTRRFHMWASNWSCNSYFLFRTAASHRCWLADLPPPCPRTRSSMLCLLTPSLCPCSLPGRRVPSPPSLSVLITLLSTHLSPLLPILYQAFFTP